MTTTQTYKVKYDATEQDAPWMVIDADGDCEGWYETKAEAMEAADELNEDARAEAIEEERQELIASIDLDDLSLDVLKKIKALIK